MVCYMATFKSTGTTITTLVAICLSCLTGNCLLYKCMCTFCTISLNSEIKIKCSCGKSNKTSFISVSSNKVANWCYEAIMNKQEELQEILTKWSIFFIHWTVTSIMTKNGCTKIFLLFNWSTIDIEMIVQYKITHFFILFCYNVSDCDLQQHL